MRSSNMWKYLIESGALERGDKEEIKRVKQEYKRMRDRENKAKRRSFYKEHVVALTDEEEALLQKEMARYGLSLSQLLKHACLCYLTQRFIVPESAAVRKMEAYLLRSLTVIERIELREKKGSWFKDKNYDSLKNMVIGMKTELAAGYDSVKLFEQALEERLVSDPAFRELLIKRLGHDSQNTGRKG